MQSRKKRGPIVIYVCQAREGWLLLATTAACMQPHTIKLKTFRGKCQFHTSFESCSLLTFGLTASKLPSSTY